MNSQIKGVNFFDLEIFNILVTSGRIIGILIQNGNSTRFNGKESFVGNTIDCIVDGFRDIRKNDNLR